MNGALRVALTNPWLASLISFLPVVALLLCLLLCAPPPLPTLAGVSGMPWWAPLGWLVIAFAVVAGLLFVDKVGAGAFAGLTITANILMSLLIDKFGMFGMPQHPLSATRIVGALRALANYCWILIWPPERTPGLRVGFMGGSLEGATS